MIQGDMTKKLWPDMIRYLLMGNSLINNLAEPQVQLGELQEKLLPFCEYLTDPAVEQSQKQLAYNELERQLKYMKTFTEQLTVVSQKIEQLLVVGNAS